MDQSQLNIKDFYRGKSILITGCTGFLGKVILEKILRSCPDVATIYVMIRSKRSTTLIDRIKFDVLSSQCFTTLKKQLGGEHKFTAYAESKIIPIHGDLVSDKLGISESDREMIRNKCNIIINSAASVNFNDPLQEALQINYFGCQRVLELAKECKNLEIITHVSTCYVNCNRLGYIEEKIYNPEADVGTLVKNIMNMSVQEIKASESKLIGDYPNTYTFTKMMAEKKLVQDLGDLNCVIWRPAIISSSVSDPFPGWTDQLSAAGGVTILGGMGFVPYLHGTGMNTVDLVPVDIVTNGLLVATCHGARKDTEKLHIYNCGTSVQNPITLYDYKETMLKYYKYLKLNEQQFKVDLQMVESQFEFNMRKKIFEDLPINTLNFIAQLPIIGTPQLKSAASKLKKMSKKINGMITVFDFFMRGDWHYENKKIYKLINMMSEEERKEFHCDSKGFDWAPYLEDYLKGMVIFVLKEDKIAPEFKMTQVMIKNYTYFDHLKEVQKYQKNFINRSSSDWEPAILSKSRFNEFLKLESGKETEKMVKRYYKAYNFDPVAISNELARVRCAIEKRAYQFGFYVATKVAHHLIYGLHIDKGSQERVKELSKNRKNRIVFLPLFKSFGDPILMHYINYFSDIELGFSFGIQEDSPKINFIDQLLRKVGCFLIQRKQQHNLSINYVNQALIQEAIESSLYTTIFLNDQRPRTGKLSQLKSPEYMIQLLLKSHFNIKKHKFDIKIVPVCINQDRIVDAEFLISEMQSGKFKPGTTLVNMMQHVVKQEKGCLGNVFVKYEEPIDLNEYIERSGSNELESIAMKLTQDLYLIQQKNQPITMNSMITSSLLYQNKSEITFKNIKETSKSIYEHILANGYKTYCSASPENYDINLAVKHLGFQVVGKPLDKHKGNEAQVILGQDNNVLALGYYSSQLTTYFSLESILTHSICYLTHFDHPTELIKTTTIQEVFTFSKFIQEIFKNEFLNQTPIEDITKMQNFLEDLKLFNIDSQGVIKINEGVAVNKVRFLKELLQSYVDTYFIVAQTLYIMKENVATIEQPKLTNQLHMSILELYNMGAVRHMHSCLTEVIDSALDRFTELGISNTHIYVQNTGEKSVFIQCSKEQKVMLQKYLQVLTGLSTSGQNKHHLRQIEKEADNAIKFSQGFIGYL